MKKISTILIAVVLIGFSFHSTSIMKTGAAETEKKIDIATSPVSHFLDMDTLKPGDTIIAPLTIQNKGNVDFTYTVTSHFDSGSHKYFDQLLLSIADSSTVIFDGKISDLSSLDPRALGSFHEEDLIFTVKVPWELGNEYQGLTTAFQLQFYVEEDVNPVGTETETLSGNEDPNLLPVTATSMFAYLLIGLIFMAIGVLLLFSGKLPIPVMDRK